MSEIHTRADAAQSIKLLTEALESGADDTVQTPTGTILPDEDALKSNVYAMLEPPSSTAPSGLSAAVEALTEHLYRGAEIPNWLDPTTIIAAAEAIKFADGSRPVFSFESGGLKDGPGNGPVFEALKRKANLIESAAKSVGRIESDSETPHTWLAAEPWYVGTAFYVGNGWALTNRHVIQSMVRFPMEARPSLAMNSAAPFYVNFGAEGPGTSRRRHEVLEVRALGLQPIIPPGQVNLARLDLAALKLADASEDGRALPDPLPLAVRSLDTMEFVGLVGFSGLAGSSLGSDEKDAIEKVFGRFIGFKTAGAGKVTARPGSYPEDSATSWALQHDASVLAGGSGSPVLDLSSGTTSVLTFALHLGGAHRVTNYAHTAERFRGEVAQLGIAVQ